MKRFIVLAVAAMVFGGMFFEASAASPAAAAKGYKIGYVDMTKIFEEYKKTKDFEKNLETKGKAKEAERATMIEELRKLKDEQALLSEKAKAEKQTVIDNKVKALQDFDRTTRDGLIKERNDMLGLIVKDIEKAGADYSKANGYDYIMNSRMLLYGGTEYDLTNEILSKLNK